MKSFYEFYQKMLREQAPAPGAPAPAQTGAVPAQAAGTPPAPATPPTNPTGAGVAPAVPKPDAALQGLQQIVAPLANKATAYINKIEDPKLKQALMSVFTQQQSAQQQPPAQAPQPAQPPTGAPPAPPATGQQPQR